MGANSSRSRSGDTEKSTDVKDNGVSERPATHLSEQQLQALDSQGVSEKRTTHVQPSEQQLDAPQAAEGQGDRGGDTVSSSADLVNDEEESDGESSLSEDDSDEASPSHTPRKAGTESEIYSFSPDDFRTVCELSESGKKRQLEQFVKTCFREARKSGGLARLYVGPSTFFPDEKSLSPVILAAQNGKVDVLDFFRKLQRSRAGSRYRWIQSSVGFDYYARAYFYYRGQTHVCTPLYAACRNNQPESVSKLLSVGADINKACKCCGETPLRVAAYFGLPKVVGLLCRRGADHTVADKKSGLTPLAVAVLQRRSNVVDILLAHGCDPFLPTMPYKHLSPVHLSAIIGNVQIVQSFMKKGVSPCHQTGSVPSPLFLAASLGHRNVVEKFLAHHDCKGDVQADAFKLLGPPWQKKEANSTFDDTLSSTAQTIAEVYYMTQEEIYPAHKISVMGLLYERAQEHFSRGSNQEVEIIWVRLANLISITLQRSVDLKATWSRIQPSVDQFVKKLSSACDQMVSEGHRPHFRLYTKFLLDTLQFVEQCDEPSNYSELVWNLLMLMATWSSSQSPVQGNRDLGVASTECEETGLQMVQALLYVMPRRFGGPDLLRFFLQKIRDHMSDNVTISYLRRPFCVSALSKEQGQTAFLDVLLQWGADDAINNTYYSNWKKERPLHYVAPSLPHLVPVLLAHGAHPDAVNSEGKTASQLCSQEAAKTHFKQDSPALLSCLACRAIASHGIPYRKMEANMPRHLIRLIELHHCAEFS